jgi:3-(3-hydroxy-phenyl)propionate hydroxylase
MLSTYTNPVYPYRASPDQRAASPVRHPLVVVGAGPVGLVAGIDAALHGIPAVVLDDNDTVSVGSRAVCYAKRALEILDRMGCAQRMVDKGITWNLGKVFFQQRMVYQFNLQPESDHHRPAFINLQQYYLEEFLVERANSLEGLDLRWKNRVTGVAPDADGVDVTIETPDGPYSLRCDYLIVADGANSSVRDILGLKSTGQVFQDRFLIADVVMKADEFPTERWFWFDPPFHRGQSTLLHRQADNVWRLDFQLGWDADPETEKQPERVIPRVKAMLGDERRFELEWCSVYTFQCRRMDRFRQGRVLFAGDAAHQVSPFGARGANSGIQDTDNLIWKLKLVLGGQAPDALLESYCTEREAAADENILNSTRSTDFITPKSETSHGFRDAALALAEHFEFARRLVNSGRLSVPTVYRDSPLNSLDTEHFEGDMVPGSPCADAPIGIDGHESWLLLHLGGRFNGLYFAHDDGLPQPDRNALKALSEAPHTPVTTLVVCPSGQRPHGMSGGTIAVTDLRQRLRQRYDGRPGTFYLLRPDQHVAARWRTLDADQVQAALTRATGQA